MHFASEKKPIRAFCISEMSTHKLIQSQNFSPISCPHSARNLHSNLVHHKVLSAHTLPLQIFPSGASPDYALDQSVALARPHWNRIQTFCPKCMNFVSLFFWLVQQIDRDDSTWPLTSILPYAANDCQTSFTMRACVCVCTCALLSLQERSSSLTWSSVGPTTEGLTWPITSVNLQVGITTNGVVLCHTVCEQSVSVPWTVRSTTYVRNVM